MPTPDPRIARELLAHQAFLKRLARDLVGGDADDLVQDVWQRALERPPRHDGQLRGWLGRVARSLAMNRWRSESRRLERERDSAVDATVSQELDERLELRKELVRALDSLSPAHRKAILLRYFEDLTPTEIAKLEGAPLATIKARLRRGLVHLREVLDRRHAGERSSWTPLVAALATPDSRTTGLPTLVLGGMTMGTLAKVSTAVVVVSACVYFATRSPRQSPDQVEVAAQSPDSTELAPSLEIDADGTTVSVGDEPYAARSPAVREARELEAAGTGKSLLRVHLDGVSEAEARSATIELLGLDDRDGWPMDLEVSWPSQGLESEFDLTEVLAALEGRRHLRKGKFEIVATLPAHLGRRTRVDLDDDALHVGDDVVYEVRIPVTQPTPWPEFSLSVLDANTREHLDDVELRIRSGPPMAAWGRNDPSSLLASGVTSPVRLVGVHDADETNLAGMTIAGDNGSSHGLVELARRWSTDRGVIVSARTPDHAWGGISIDVSKGDRELLLKRGAALRVQLANVQLESYAALGAEPMLAIYRIREDGGNQYEHFEALDRTLATEGVRIDGLEPGGYRAAVELGGGVWPEMPVLGIEEIHLVAGESGEVLLALDDAPRPPSRASIGGVVSFPAPSLEWARENAKLEIYFQPTERWMKPDYELPLDGLEQVGGALPSWAFLLEDLPVGSYRIQLAPFLTCWLVDLEADGATELELVMPELAEVEVDVVDARTRELVPKDSLYFRRRTAAPGQRNRNLAPAVMEAPGRFRFLTAPGTVRIWPKWPNGAEREFGGNGLELELVAGRQRVEFEITPTYAMRIEFREDGVALPTGPQGMHTTKDIRGVGHEGRVIDGGLQRDMIVEVSEPGTYELDFDRVTTDRYLAIAPRRVEVQADVVTTVVVELHKR